MNTGVSGELSITKGSRALRNFTDRDEFTRRFAEYSFRERAARVYLRSGVLYKGAVMVYGPA